MKLGAGAVVFVILLTLALGVGGLQLISSSERLVGRIADQEIAASGLHHFMPPADMPLSRRLAHLQRQYQDPRTGGELNLAYARAVLLWNRQLPALQPRARLATPPVDEARLAYEIDKRFAPGAAALMAAHYQAYRDAMAVAREDYNARLEENRRQHQELLEAVEQYRARHGRYPPDGSYMEDGRLVTP